MRCDDVPSVRPTQLLKRFQKCRVACLSAGRVFCYWLQDSDPTQGFTLLCARCKRPRRCRAACHPDELAPSHCLPRGSGQGTVPAQTSTLEGAVLTLRTARYADRPKSALGHKRTFAVQNGISALHPIADICSALAHVRFVPIADIETLTRSPRRRELAMQAGCRCRTFWPFANL
jgi:hypothetical protein